MHSFRLECVVAIKIFFQPQCSDSIYSPEIYWLISFDNCLGTRKNVIALTIENRENGISIL